MFAFSAEFYGVCNENFVVFFSTVLKVMLSALSAEFYGVRVQVNFDV